MNISFVSHGGLISQSTYHIISIAECLLSFGHKCIICIPEELGDRDEGILSTDVPLISFRTVREKGLVFPNGKNPDLVHAWTPRENVKIFAQYLSQKYCCPYFVHLEDNEREILNRELQNITYEKLAELPGKEQEQYIVNKWMRINPADHWKFLKNACGCTVLIDRLKEHVPQGVPVQLFWPSYDRCFNKDLSHEKSKLREKYNIPEDSFVVLYSGAIHEINLEEASRMITVLKILSLRKMPLVFIKTGSNSFPALLDSGIKEGWIKDLGFIPREVLCEIYAISDILIQPGNSDPFNDYRFPSKLPEAMIQKLPVILPFTNLGEILKDNEEAVITRDGTMDELKLKIISLFENPEKRRIIAEGAYSFAKNKLSWEKSAKIIELFYENCLLKSQKELRDQGIIQENETNNLTTTSVIECNDLLSRLRAPLTPDEIGKTTTIVFQSSCATNVGSNIKDAFLEERRFKKYKRRYNRILYVLLIILFVLVLFVIFNHKYI